MSAVGRPAAGHRPRLTGRLDPEETSAVLISLPRSRPSELRRLGAVLD